MKHNSKTTNNNSTPDIEHHYGWDLLAILVSIICWVVSNYNLALTYVYLFDTPSKYVPVITPYDSDYRFTGSIFLVTCILTFVLFRPLLTMEADRPKKPSVAWYVKWYVNGFLFIPVLSLLLLGIMLTAFTGKGVWMALIPLIGFIAVPNCILHAVTSSRKWDGIFYENGNLSKFADNRDFYRITE